MWFFGRPVGVCAQNSLAGVCGGGGSHPHLDPRIFSVFLSYSFAIFTRVALAKAGLVVGTLRPSVHSSVRPLVCPQHFWVTYFV